MRVHNKRKSITKLEDWTFTFQSSKKKSTKELEINFCCNLCPHKSCSGEKCKELINYLKGV